MKYLTPSVRGIIQECYKKHANKQNKLEQKAKKHITCQSSINRNINYIVICSPQPVWSKYNSISAPQSKNAVCAF